MKPIENNLEARNWRRRTQSGQSAIVAVIVLFLLLFIAAIFISIVTGNLKNTTRAANVSAAGKFAEAGINYLDTQLTNSPEGADWRPVPTCAYNQACTAISQADPDYFWLKPYDPATGQGGYTRLNFGNDVSGVGGAAAQSGGRALVRVTYQPGAIDPNTKRVDPLSRYIKLEAIGRVGQIIDTDPTTYANSEKLSQRVELLAYKGIGLNEYVRNITNKDNKSVTVALGTDMIVRDRGQALGLESVYEGGVRVNAPLTFYGVNRFILHPERNDALEVAGAVRLNGIKDSPDTADPNYVTYINNLIQANQLLTAVYVTVPGLNGDKPIVPSAFGANPNLKTPSILPSNAVDITGRSLFTTLGPEFSNATSGTINGYALARDNPNGNEIGNLPTTTDNFNNTYQNLRSTPRLAPPLIDRTIGENGLTRYRALTRDSAPLRPSDVSNNPVTIGTDLAGLRGWGQGLYINNTGDVQTASLTNLLGEYNQRNDWLSPKVFKDQSYWRGDQSYAPPAVTITLYPRYMKIEPDTRSNSQQAYLFTNTGAASAGTIIRYTPVPSGTAPADRAGQVLEGYPARLDADGIPSSGDESYYSGDLVIYAEGNIRIRGVVGGLDRETSQYFKRHLTVVSNATIYVDGNLLRDNITGGDTNPTAAQVRGQSSIALLAKDYIAVNTTQFFNAKADPSADYTPESGTTAPYTQTLQHGATSHLQMTWGFGPILAANGYKIPGYLTGDSGTLAPTLFIRHAANGKDASGNTISANTAITLTLNETVTDPTKWFDFAGGMTNNAVSFGLNSDDSFTNVAFTLPAGVLYPNLAGNGTIGFTNVAEIRIDDSTPNDYRQTRATVVPADIRIEAMMYAQEGSFFIIPGPWFNPITDDTFDRFVNGADNDSGTVDSRQEHRSNDIPGRHMTYPLYPFYGEPLDVRITFCGSINENLPAAVGDQGAWMEKWGWVPTNYGSTGLTVSQAAQDAGYLPQNATQPTMHGPNSPLPDLRSGNLDSSKGPLVAANGIVYQFDDRAIYPYAPTFSSEAGRPLRPNPYNPTQPLPFAPRLPVAPGLLYYGQNPVR